MCFAHDGIHVYYSDKGSVPSAKLLPLTGMGLDVFGPYDGMKRASYVLAPPSMHPSGDIYTWQAGQSPLESPLQPFPADMVSALNEYIAQHKGSDTDDAGKNNVLDFEDRIHRTNLSLDDEENVHSLRQYDRDSRFVKAACDYMGIPFEPGKPFCSPLRPDTHPSASIHRAPDGSYRYHDFTEDTKYYSLAQLYGALVTGQSHPLPKLSGVRFAVWQTRLLLDTGWKKDPPPVSIPPLPKGAPQTAIDMYNGYRQLLIYRSVFYGRVVPAPYTHSFAAQWTGAPINDATAGVEWLKRNGFLIQHEKIEQKGGRPMSLFVPANYVEPGGNENE